MFDVDTFLAELVACGEEVDPRRAVEAIVTRAMTEPGAIAEALAPTVGGIRLLHQAPDLTILDIAWAPGMRLMPHDHRMWAVIGIYAGIEDNHFYRRAAPGELVKTADRRLEAGAVCALGTETIHAVTNPAASITGAIHVYGGDFVHQPRSQWGPGDLVERPYDIEVFNQQFHDANVAAGLTGN